MATIDALRDFLWERADGLCGICRTPVARGDMEIDHVIARAKGGLDTMPNLQPAHSLCNKLKGDGVRPRAPRDPALSRLHRTVRFPEDLLATAKMLAAREGRSLNTQLIRVLRAWADQETTSESSQ